MPHASIPDVTEELRAFLAHGLVLDPWLAGLDEEHFEFGSQDLLYGEAGRLTLEHWQEPLITTTIDAYPVPERFAHTAVHEILISSAAAIAHEQGGRLHITQDVAREAMGRMRGFVAARGFGPLVLIYGTVTFDENHAAVRHYGGLPEADFVLGRRHRPWVRYRLDDELLAGLALGALRLEVREGRRWVAQTGRGDRLYREARAMLERSGYLEQRLRLIYLSQFNLFHDWDAQVAAMAPDAMDIRHDFTRFAALPPGGAVLEVGCGMATQTFEGGLWEAVGPAGWIVGLDPSPGMLERARAKAEQRSATNVTFVWRRAEHLSQFQDGQFDATAGALFLHFTDIPVALGELRRVTKPGGAITVLAGGRPAFQRPWFRRWFRPIFDLARRHGGTVRSHLHAPGEVGQAFVAAGLRDVHTVSSTTTWVLREPAAAVAFLVQGLSFFQRELELLPWAAREELVEELVRRGEVVCSETTPEQRTLRNPFEFVKGIVPAKELGQQ